MSGVFFCTCRLFGSLPKFVRGCDHVVKFFQAPEVPSTSKEKSTKGSKKDEKSTKGQSKKDAGGDSKLNSPHKIAEAVRDQSLTKSSSRRSGKKTAGVEASSCENKGNSSPKHQAPEVGKALVDENSNVISIGINHFFHIGPGSGDWNGLNVFVSFLSKDMSWIDKIASDTFNSSFSWCNFFFRYFPYNHAQTPTKKYTILKPGVYGYTPRNILVTMFHIYISIATEKGTDVTRDPKLAICKANGLHGKNGVLKLDESTNRSIVKAQGRGPINSPAVGHVSPWGDCFFPRGPMIFFTSVPILDDETLTQEWHLRNFQMHLISSHKALELTNFPRGGCPRTR